MADTFATATISGTGSLGAIKTLSLTATIDGGALSVVVRKATIDETLIETPNFDDPSTYDLVSNKTVSEGLGLADSDPVLWGLAYFIQEGYGLTDSDPVPFELGRLVQEGLGLTPTALGSIIANLIEALGMGDTASAGFRYGRTLSEGIQFADRIELTWYYLVQEGIGLTPPDDTDFYVHGKYQRVAETLVASGVVTSVIDAYNTIAETLFLADVAARQFAPSITETPNFADTLSELALKYHTVLESLYLSETVSEIQRAYLVVEEEIGQSETTDLRQVLVGLISDGIALGDIRFVPDTTGTAWVINTNSTGVSEYDNYLFNSFAVRGTDYLGATETGIYHLSGDDDAGTAISAKLRTGLMQFATSRKKRVSDLYIGYRSDGRLVMKAIYNMDNTRSEAWYELVETSNAYDTARFKVGKGAKARYWAFELINQDGADFELDQLEMYAVPLTRRL